MTYALEKAKVGRRPLTVVELAMDFCGLRYGISPCTAAGATKCFNTLATCQDTANYTLASAVLLNDPLTSSTGWATYYGSPTFVAGIFSGGIVTRNFGAGDDLRIKGAIGTAPTATPGEYITIGFCVSADFASYYSLNATSAGWYLYKSGVLLTSWLTPPANADTFRIEVVEGGSINVYINGTLRLTSTDTDLRGNTYIAIGALVAATVTVDPTATKFVVETMASLGGTRVYRFVSKNADAPPTLGAIPSLAEAVKFSSAKADIEGGLGRRASVTVTFRDHPHHDRGIDPYVTERSYTPEEQGTFWGKFRARNLYYQGRLMHVYTGFISADGLDFPGDFQKRTYIIEKIEGPDSRGLVRITAKDILKLADNNRATCPKASSGKLYAAISAGATSLTLSPAGSDWTTEYPSGGGTIRIDSEVITYSSRSTDTLSGLTRGTDGTTAATHSEGAAVQLCARFTAERVDSILNTLLTTYAGIPAAYVPYVAEWQAEISTWRLQHRLTRLITEPIGVNQLIAEICTENELLIWWEETEQEIKLKALRPVTPTDTVTDLDDTSNFTADSISVVDDPSRRLSQVWVFFANRNPVEGDDASNFGEAIVKVDVDAEDATQYGEKRVKAIKSKWFTASNRGEALSLASRTLARRRNNPRLYSFNLDARDATLKIGDVVDAQSTALQDADGSYVALRVQIIEVEEIEAGSVFRYSAVGFVYSGRYFYVAPNGTPNYSSASAAEKSKYGFICPNTGTFTDGTEGYKLI